MALVEDKTRECVMTAKATIAASKKENFPGVCLSTMGCEDNLREILGTISGYTRLIGFNIKSSVTQKQGKTLWARRIKHDL